jgi:hypothetical protein
MTTLTYNRTTGNILAATTISAGGTTVTGSAVTLTAGYLAVQVAVNIVNSGTVTTAGTFALNGSSDGSVYYQVASIAGPTGNNTSITTVVEVPSGTAYLQAAVGSNVGGTNTVFTSVYWMVSSATIA